jgi:hypothetical protein
MELLRKLVSATATIAAPADRGNNELRLRRIGGSHLVQN